MISLLSKNKDVFMYLKHKQYLLHIKHNFVEHYLNNLYVITPDGKHTFKYEDGMLSGVKITNLFESLINLLLIVMICCKMTGQSVDTVMKNICAGAMGDDNATGSNFYIDIAVLSNYYNKFGFYLSDGKSRVSKHSFDFLRHVIYNNRIVSYGLRAVGSVLYCKPWNNEKFLTPEEYLVNILDLLYRCKIPLYSYEGIAIATGPLPNKNILKFLSFQTIPQQEMESYYYDSYSRSSVLSNSLFNSKYTVSSIMNKMGIPDMVVSSPNYVNVLLDNKSLQSVKYFFSTILQYNCVPTERLNSSLIDLVKHSYRIESHNVSSRLGIEHSISFNVDQKLIVMSQKKFQLLLSSLKYDKSNIPLVIMQLIETKDLYIKLCNKYNISRFLLYKILYDKVLDIQSIGTTWGSVREPLLNKRFINHFNYTFERIERGISDKKHVTFIMKKFLNNFQFITNNYLFDSNQRNDILVINL